MGRLAIAISAALALLAASPAPAKSSPPVIGYVAAFKSLDRIVDRADFTRYTHVDLAFVNPGREGAISVDGRLACAPDGPGGANVSPRSLRRLVETAHRAGAKVLVSVGGGVIPACSGDWAQLLEPANRGPPGRILHREVGHDPADQGQGSLSLFERKELELRHQDLLVTPTRSSPPEAAPDD